MSEWTTPSRVTVEGKYCIVAPLSKEHGDELFSCSTLPGVEDRFRYLPEQPHDTRNSFDAWFIPALDSVDPMFFVVIDRATGRVGGRHSLMRIVPQHGVIEIGHIHWSPLVAGTRVATEAFYLMAEYVFDTLKYRRFEWKCNNKNEHSKRAALRLGFTFEGVFRQHLIVKGENRDTAWFSIIDSEWPTVKAALASWLHESNFDNTGGQLKRLHDFK